MEEDEVEKLGQNLKTDQIQSLTRRSMDLDKWEYLCSPLEHSVFDFCQYDMLIYHIYICVCIHYISKIYIYIVYIHPPGQRPRKTWPFNSAEKDLLLLDEDLLLLGPFGSKVKMSHGCPTVIYKMHKPIIVDLNFRIATSLHRPNIQFAVYHRVPHTILSLGVQGWNHHKRMVFELSGAQNR